MNDVARLVKLMCRLHGWTAEPSNGHWKLRAPFGALVVASGTASDHRAYLNVRGDIRRAYRFNGLKSPI